MNSGIQGLESWTTSPEYRAYFRKRLWGTTTMVRAVLTDRERWIAALMLDPETGLDPPGIKVRAAQGLDAASTFVPGEHPIFNLAQARILAYRVV